MKKFMDGLTQEEAQLILDMLIDPVKASESSYKRLDRIILGLPAIPTELPEPLPDNVLIFSKKKKENL